MSIEEENKEVVRRLVEEVWNNKNLDLIPELIATDYILHGRSGEYKGQEGHKRVIELMNNAFPNYQTIIELLFGENDMVVYRGKFQGTHKGKTDLMGIAPTGKSVSVDDCTIFRIQDGKIAEEWGNLDTFGLLQQLGAIPSQ
jgi:predicted ester cyclase